MCILIAMLVTLLGGVLILLGYRPTLISTSLPQSSKKADDQNSAAVVPVGMASINAPDVDPMSGKKTAVRTVVEHRAIFYFCDSTSYIHGVEFTPIELVENGKSRKKGITLPIFSIDILSVENTSAVTGMVLQSFNYRSLLIGESNYFAVEKSVDQGRKVAVRLSVDRSLPLAQQILKRKEDYYFTIKAKKVGTCPVATTVLSVPLYQTGWRHDLFYDAAISFQ